MDSSKTLELKLYNLIKSLTNDLVIYNNKFSGNYDLNNWENSHNELKDKNQEMFPTSSFIYKGQNYLSKAPCFKSVVRGDIIIEKKDSLIIIDSKDYINRNFKPSPYVNNDRFTKTMDTPLKRLVSSNFFRNIFKVNNISELISLNLDHTISKKELTQLIMYIENGYISFAKPTKKYFISYQDKFKVWSINYDLIPQEVHVKSVITDGYIYVCFFNKDELIYEVSARADFSANCAHLNRKYILSETMSEEYLEKFLKVLISKTEFNKNYKIIMPSNYLNDVIKELKNKRMTSEQIVNFVIHKFKLEDNKDIRTRIKKDLNPSFKNKCLGNNIEYYDGVYFKSISITKGK